MYRPRLLAAATLLLPALLSAQVEPTLARPLSHRPSFMPTGSNRISDCSIQDGPLGTKFVGIASQQSPTGPFSLKAFDYHRSSNTLTPRPDYDSITLNTQEIASTPDLNTVAVNEVGVGPRVLRRASRTAPWGSPQMVQNLPGTAHGLEFCTVNGVLSLLACMPGPNSHLRLYPYDATQVSVGSPVVLAPPLGSPNNFVAFAIALEDDLGNTRGFLACIRQQVGFQQQWVFTGGVDGSSPWSVFFNTPANSFFVGGDQLDGGHVVAANSGLPIAALPNGPIDVIGTFTFDTNATILGGWTDVTAMGPPGDLGLIGIAVNLAPPIQLPGFVNAFGLDVGTLLIIWAQVMPNGVLQQLLALPPTSPFVFRLQSLSLGTPPAPNVFGSTASLRGQ